MMLRNASALVGPGLVHERRVDICVDGGRFGRVQAGLRPAPGEESADCEGLLAIPGLVNAHTHIGDSIGKDAALGRGADGRIHPVSGAKSRILGRTGEAHLAAFMTATCRSMVRRGITAFADFREGGLAGVLLLRRVLAGLPIRGTVLGRVEHYDTPARIRAGAPLPRGRGPELRSVLDACDGLGVSGANENSDPALRRYSRTGKIRAIHCSETAQSVSRSRRMTGRTETERALLMRPHVLVHMTHAARADLEAAAGRVRGIVVCPRANGSLAGGIPDVVRMIGAGCTVALGTDNVMVNTPDMFREMDYLWKATMGMHRRRLDPREVLKMATVNGDGMLGGGAGYIAPGRLADCVLVDRHSLDLDPVHDPHAAIVHRASGSSVRAVMIGGRIVHGRI